MVDGFSMLRRAALVPTLNDNVSRFRTLLHADVNSDAQFRFIECAGTRLCVLYIEGMADDRKISDFILRAWTVYVPTHLSYDSKKIIHM